VYPWLTECCPGKIGTALDQIDVYDPCCPNVPADVEVLDRSLYDDTTSYCGKTQCNLDVWNTVPSGSPNGKTCGEQVEWYEENMGYSRYEACWAMTIDSNNQPECYVCLPDFYGCQNFAFNAETDYVGSSHAITYMSQPEYRLQLATASECCEACQVDNRNGGGCTGFAYVGDQDGVSGTCYFRGADGERVDLVDGSPVGIHAYELDKVNSPPPPSPPPGDPSAPPPPPPPAHPPPDESQSPYSGALMCTASTLQQTHDINPTCTAADECFMRSCAVVGTGSARVETDHCCDEHLGYVAGHGMCDAADTYTYSTAFVAQGISAVSLDSEFTTDGPAWKAFDYSSTTRAKVQNSGRGKTSAVSFDTGLRRSRSRRLPCSRLGLEVAS